MKEINWYGNDGRTYPDPGTVDRMECGVCDTSMDVERNVFRATTFAEHMGHARHLHDCFTCPNRKADWHQQIFALKMDVYAAEIQNALDYEERKQFAEKEILELLKIYVS